MMAEIARQLTEYRFVVPCRLQTPMHVGAGTGLQFSDSPLRRTASGKLVIPGTSLAGVLRANANDWTVSADVYWATPTTIPRCRVIVAFAGCLAM